ncbi:hypothetical protein RFI_34534, partial [Reticulomyxa filosa]
KEQPGNNDLIHKMRESQEDQQEIKDRSDCHDYSKIELITKFDQMYVRYKQIFLSSNPIKFVSSQEELKKKYGINRSKLRVGIEQNIFEEIG